ncbi:MAG: protein TolR [Gammaproteobacteria bacterium GWE2_42_36]|nr:MAG: protein TolR [Gammaproteobacteria bacterium GWE2_42_36]HCU04875.1 protein TolR [Coxiellaceae bacterium]
MRTRSKRRAMAEINVVPYIDVMLVLLIIFMITAPLLSQGVQVSLPQAQSKPIASKDNLPIIVSVDAAGAYYLNIAANPQSPILAGDLVTRIAAEIAIAKQNNQDRMVLVRGDQAANYGNVVQAMVLLQKAGVVQVGLMTQTPARES